MRLPQHGPVLFCILLIMGALLLVSGCVTEKPVVQVPATTIVPVTSAAIPSITSSTPSTLTFYTEVLPPFNYEENGTLRGISIDLLEAATAKMGQPVTRDQVHLGPWNEGYQAALTKNNTIIFSTARLPEREQIFKWAGPIYTERVVLFGKPNSGITIKNVSDLNKYRIGVVTDDIGMLQVLGAGVNKSQLVQDTNASVLVNKLNNSEIDLWGYPETAGRYFTKQQTGNYSAFNVVYSFEDLDYYYAINKGVPDATVQSFQQALDAVRLEKDSAGISTYDKIVGRYVPNAGAGQK